MKKTRKWRLAQKVELWWWKNYLQKKDKATYLEWKKNYWQQLLMHVEAVTPIPPEATILDAGCGPAGVFICFPNNKVTAVDPLLSEYGQHLGQFDLQGYPWVNFVNAPLEKYTCDRPFDFVFCMNAVNHVSDLPKAWEVLSACTRDAGYLIVTIDAHNHGIFKRLFRLVPGDILHPHQYDLTEYREMIRKGGFNILSELKVKKGFFFDHYILVAQKTGKQD